MVEKTRNICILAHVDHGKTTLADHLISGAGGGLIHPKQAGKLRYLDYRDDEQQRAITMKSASIALKFRGHMMNLIDSPGHIDFCSEVSTAVRLSDGALVLVDACEGVHIQTHAVLRQAWAERVKPCLVLNKVDRLITELKLTPMEAYDRMQGIVAAVNIIMSGFRSEKYLSDVDSILSSTTKSGESNTELQTEDLEDENEADSEEDEFAPQKGNVAFSSALDGWAFRTDQFANLYAAKLGASATSLRKSLWGDFFYSPKDKKIIRKKAAAGKLKPMFVQLVLEPLWKVYECISQGEAGAEMLSKVIKSMSLSIPPRELLNRDPRSVTLSVMSRWLPLADNILGMVLDVLPHPGSAQLFRTDHMLPRRLVSSGINPEAQAEIEAVREAVHRCDSREEAPCVTFVSKMFAVPVEMLPRHESLVLNAGDSDASSRECFLAFARVFSGVIHVGQKLFVLSALYDPTEEKRSFQVASVEALYLMMGRGLEPCERVSAGNVVAIRGLGQFILKSATLCSSPFCWPFAGLNFQAAPIVRVAVEPSDPANLSALSRGLKLLNRADPFVEVSLSSTGEHVISAAGEVHLELCIKDLRERFACVELEVSPPLVAFRETIDDETSSSTSDSSSDNKPVELTTPNGRFTVRVNVERMSKGLCQALDESEEVIKSLFSGKKKLETTRTSGEAVQDPVGALRSRLLSATTEKDERHLLNRIWALGPRGVGPNMLLVPERCRDNEFTAASGVIRGFPQVSELLGLEVDDHHRGGEKTGLAAEAESLVRSVLTGFQLATAAGPLCDEPAWGLIFTVESFLSENSGSSVEMDQHVFAGQVISTVKEACRAAVMKRKPRLVEVMYLCEVSTSSQYLGQMYGVLAKRRARVLKEEMREGTDMFTVHAFMPVSESFGFADELRRRTSGAASPQLMLSHWETLNEDPFFVPKTEEEVEEFGDGSSVAPNTARKLIDAVRRRKGLPVEEKVVKHATKQRTLARKV